MYSLPLIVCSLGTPWRCQRQASDSSKIAIREIKKRKLTQERCGGQYVSKLADKMIILAVSLLGICRQGILEVLVKSLDITIFIDLLVGSISPP